jgi:RNA polymerase sigma-70 factor (ECF subfamily)
MVPPNSLAPSCSEAVARFVAAASAAEPELALDEAAFAEHVAKLEGSGATALDEASPADVALAWAAARGDARAIAAIERRHMPAVRIAVARVLGDDRAEHAMQQVRTKLFVREDGPPRIAEYQGRGSLPGWLRVVAVRAALSLRRKSKRAEDREASDEPLIELAGPLDPELDGLKSRYRGELKSAFQSALAALSARDRNLLRMHFVERLTIDELGVIHSVHRATIARWIAALRERLFDATRDDLTRRLGVDRAEFDSLVALVRSQLDVSLHRFLDVDDDAPTP